MNSFVIGKLATEGFVQKSEGVFTDGDLIIEFDSQFWRIGNNEGILLDEGARTKTDRLFKYLDTLK